MTKVGNRDIMDHHIGLGDDFCQSRLVINIPTYVSSGQKFSGVATEQALTTYDANTLPPFPFLLSPPLSPPFSLEAVELERVRRFGTSKKKVFFLP